LTAQIKKNNFSGLGLTTMMMFLKNRRIK